MAISGLSIHFHEALSLTKDTTDNLKEIHELVFNATLIFVLLHIIGVVVAEVRDEPGIISDMIHGRNKT